MRKKLCCKIISFITGALVAFSLPLEAFSESADNSTAVTESSDSGSDNSPTDNSSSDNSSTDSNSSNNSSSDNSSAESASEINGREPDTPSEDGDGKNTIDEFSDNSRTAYRSYIKSYSDADKPLKNVEIDVSEFKTSDGANCRKTSFEEEDCVSWPESEGTVTWEFDVENEGLYNLEMVYYPVSGKNTTVDVELKLDGKHPFDEMRLLELDRYWHNKTAAIQYDENNKHQKRSPQVEYDCWVTYPIKDRDGVSGDPYFFFLSRGHHTLSLTGVRTNIYLKSMRFYNAEELPTYANVRPTHDEMENTPPLLNDEAILVEAETPLYTNSSMLYPTYDRSDYTMSPSHPVNKRYNTIGMDTWNKSTQIAAYKFTVPADGYYCINLKCRQNTLRGIPTNRRVYVNGKVPCKELDDVKIKYDPNWQTVTLCDRSGDPIYVKLTQGDNTIAFEAVPGDIGEVTTRLSDVISTLNTYYQRIVMITSTDPDEYKDYLLDEKIPELPEVFQAAVDALEKEKSGIEAAAGEGAETAGIETLIVVLKMAIKRPDNVPMMVSSRRSGLRDQINNVAASICDLRAQPLEMDYFEVKTIHEEFRNAKPNFFKSLSFGFRKFIGSFFEDYTSISQNSSERALDVWVGLGRDQANVINEIVTSEYNPERQTKVRISLVQGSILEATLAGKGPEAALFVGGDFPVVCASRGLTVDISQMAGYEAVASRFPKSISTLYEYDGGIYGLPLTDTFPMMFYRKDILEQLGREPPETWDDLITMLPDLQSKYLQVGLILPSNISSQVFDPGNTFVLLMNQSGQSFYNPDRTATLFDTEKSVEAFTQWTNFYTVFDFRQSYDPYALFRTGEMPIVIYPGYAWFYNQLSVAAPEIKGCWDFTHVPGTVRTDGGRKYIDYTANSTSQGAVIFSDCSNKDAAWDFLQWFTSADIQAEYGNGIEAVLGPVGRYDTANIEALSRLNWSENDYQKISDQMNNLREVPIIPASYAVTRNVYNAFRSVVNNKKNPRSQLASYNREINSEIVRKNQKLNAN